MDEIDLAVEIGKQALYITLKISIPLLAIGLVVGLAVSIIQAITQIQEQTLSFVPKILAVVLLLAILLPWFIAVMVNYSEGLFTDLNVFHAVRTVVGR